MVLVCGSADATDLLGSKLAATLLTCGRLRVQPGSELESGCPHHQAHGCFSDDFFFEITFTDD
jgi:hypothetical protein